MRMKISYLVRLTKEPESAAQGQTCATCGLNRTTPPRDPISSESSAYFPAASSAWTTRDSNPEPPGYEPDALTVELMVRYPFIMDKKEFLLKEKYFFA